MLNIKISKEKEKSDEEISRQNHPFDDDLLNRKEFAETIAKIVTNTTSSYVYNINSKYGTGKTFFLRRLNCLLNKNGCISILYNSWENDLYEHPIIPLTQEISKALNTDKNKLKKFIKPLRNSALKILCNSNTVGRIIYSTYDEIKNDPTKCAHLLSEYASIKDLIENFRNSLQNLTEKINKNLVICIDELDRCKPDYAIKTLETIKHFFNIDKVVFILAMDRSQIESVIQVLYGSNMANNSSEYLRKFIDQDFYLPEPKKEDYLKFLCRKYLLSLIKPYCYPTDASLVNLQRIFIHNKNLSVNTGTSNKNDDYIVNEVLETFIKMLDFTSNFYGFSLRAQEQLVKKIEVFIAALDQKNDILAPELIVLLNSAHFFDTKLFEAFLRTYSLESTILAHSKYEPLSENIIKKGGDIHATNNDNMGYIKVWNKYLLNLTKNTDPIIPFPKNTALKYISLVLTLGKIT